MKNQELIKKYADTEYPIIGDYNTKRYGNDRMNEYVQKNLANVVQLSNGMLCGYSKPTIETRFCFSDEGPQYEYYKELCSDNNHLKSYFLSRNTKELDEMISVYENGDNKMPCVYDYENGLCKPSWCWRNDEHNDNYLPINEQDTKVILEMLYEIRKDLIKRLETWWKKYGVEKLHIWTYWANA